eukprot:scaffold187659_cov23-Tisochrysis_lutea.AAC.2
MTSAILAQCLWAFEPRIMHFGHHAGQCLCAHEKRSGKRAGPCNHSNQSIMQDQQDETSQQVKRWNC